MRARTHAHAPAFAARVAFAALAAISAVITLGCGPHVGGRGRAAAPIGVVGLGSGQAEPPTYEAGSRQGPPPLPADSAYALPDDEPEGAAGVAVGGPIGRGQAGWGEVGTGSGPNEAGRGAAPIASRYASLDRAACEVELGKRRIPFERVGEARGVVAPLRLTGPIAGIDFHSMLPAAQRRTSPYEIYDCRLVLALDDWARVLARHDVVEVVHYSVYRPPPSKQVLNGPGRRHSGALAIDAAIFRTRDGQTLSVEKDFHGRIGSKPCGKGAAPPTGWPASAATLRSIVCEAADEQLFNVMLTPDYNWPHRNHFHLEVTSGARWVLVR